MGARPPTRMTPVPRIRSGGTASPLAYLDVQSVAGPATYATSGIPVDLSATYTTVLCVAPTRAYITATKVAFGSNPQTVNETGSDLFTNAKFRIFLLRSTTPAGTISTPTFTGSALGGGHSCGAVGCDSSHPNTTTLPAGTNSTPTFTSTGSTSLSELGNGSSNTSGNTYEFLVVAI